MMTASRLVSKLRTVWLHHRRSQQSRRALPDLCDGMASMLDAGLPITQVLQYLKVQYPKAPHHTYVRLAEASVAEGRTLSSVWQVMVPPLFYTLLRAGEEAGQLQRVLRMYLAHIQDRADSLKKLAKSLTYPAVLTMLTTLLLIFISTIVLPTFNGMYVQLGMHPSGLITGVEIVLSALPKLSSGCIGVALLLGIVFYVVRRMESKVWTRISKRLPGMRFLTLFRTLMFSMLMALLLEAGIPVIDALVHLEQAGGNKWMGKRSGEIHANLMMGMPLAQAFGSEWDPVVPILLGWAEQTGELPEVFARAERLTRAALERRIQKVLRVLEPGLLVVMGALVAGTMASLFVPMYDLMTTISAGHVHG